MEAKSTNYDEERDVKVFLEKVSLSSELKRYEEEKAVHNLAVDSKVMHLTFI